jgi:hypothetical protein
MRKIISYLFGTALGTFYLPPVVAVAQTDNTSLGLGALQSISSGKQNTAVGGQALFSNTTNTQNTAVGYRTLYNTNSDFPDDRGSQNTALGAEALFSNTSGWANAATGYRALFTNTTGTYNTANGHQALYSNTIARFNTAFGALSLFSNINGEGNTALGASSLNSNISGFNNTASGLQALYSNISGNNNTATGASALYGNTTGNYNTATGNLALYANITGAENTAIGGNALPANTIGSGNTSLGFNSLYTNNTGVYNTAVGYASLAQNIEGTSNVAVGLAAGYSNSNYSSTFVGTLTSSSVPVYNSTALGFQAVVNESNQVRIGNSGVTSIGGFTNWTNLSDGRFKKNVKEDVPGLAFINILRPVTYTLDIEGIDSKLKTNKANQDNAALKGIAKAGPTAQEVKAKAEKAKVKYTGFVAQEVEQAAAKVGYDFSGVDAPKDKDGYYGLRYAEFVVPIVKSVQELNKKNEALQSQIQQAFQQIDKLKELVAKLSNPPAGNNTNNTILNTPNAYLEQNFPNPHNGNTAIRYHLPEGTGNAQVVITNMKGQVIRRVTLNNRGDGQITLNASTLAAGTYNYSLWIGGKEVDTKRMVVGR